MDPQELDLGVPVGVVVARSFLSMRFYFTYFFLRILKRPYRSRNRFEMLKMADDANFLKRRQKTGLENVVPGIPYIPGTITEMSDGVCSIY